MHNINVMHFLRKFLMGGPPFLTYKLRLPTDLNYTSAPKYCSSRPAAAAAAG